MLADGQGNVYITVWVLRAYPNHGRGRIWRLSTKGGVERLRPHSAPAPPSPRPSRMPASGRCKEIQAADDFPRLRDALTSPAHFVRAALEPDLERPITRGTPSPALFEVYLATVEQIAPEFVNADPRGAAWPSCDLIAFLEKHR